MSSPEFVTICVRCGSPLTREGIALAARGLVIDFNGRTIEEGADICFCVECRTAFLEYCQGGITAALARMREA